MVIVTVSGARSNIGKTALCSVLLNRLDGFAAIKVQTGGMYTSVTDVEEVVDEEGKDTHLLKLAGACPVVLVSCPASDTAEALDQAFVLAGDTFGVLVEGNTPARLLKADISFYVTGPDINDAKPGALDLLKKADVVVVNIDDPEPPQATVDAVRGVNRLCSVKTIGALRNGCPELDKLTGISGAG
jgi:hypothetical protein